MRPIGNVAGKLDLSKPFTQADVRRALGEIKAPSIRQVAKAGYGIELLQPTPVARACAMLAGRVIRPIPRFVRG